MSDYGQDIKLGVFITPTADPIEHSIEMIRLADALGLDLATVQDHPYQPSFGDAWTLLTAAGALTEQIHLSPNVTNLPLRPPLALAKQTATLDRITNGRVELGLGAGLFWDAIEAWGVERLSAGESIEALDEAIEMIRTAWSGAAVKHEGKHYQAHGAKVGPKPAHDIPIWVGALKPRILRLVGRVADGWAPSMSYASPDAIEEMSKILDEAAQKAGRNPADIIRNYNIQGTFGTGAGLLEGTPENWAEQLTELTLRNGSSTYVLATDDPRQMQTFAEEVGPRLKELVAQARSSAAAPEAVSETVPEGEQGPDETITVVASDGTAERHVAASESVPAAPEEPVGAERADLPETTKGQSGNWPAKLSVLPTPDDGTRLTGELDWDESTRPSFLESADASYPVEPMASHFMDVHNHLRGELDQVREVLDQVRRGAMSVGAARSAVNEMTLRQNNWTLGAYCENYCSTVTRHHTMEDQGVFPHLRKAEPGLGPVLDRLEDEHHVIHDVLTDFDKALVGLVAADGSAKTTSDALEAVQHQLDLLTDTLLSHFSYEERELLPAMARVGLMG